MTARFSAGLLILLSFAYFLLWKSKIVFDYNTLIFHFNNFVIFQKIFNRLKILKNKSERFIVHKAHKLTDIALREH